MKPTQVQMFYQAHRLIADILHTFIGIQQGPHPLTLAEIDTLIAKHGRRYAWMKPYADRLRADKQGEGN